MACACRSKLNSGNSSAQQTTHSGAKASTAAIINISVEELPHTVLPGESCIFCAGKHVATAYSMYQSNVAIANIIGDLELARRHTLKEFQDVAHDIAELEYHFCIRDTDYAIHAFPGLIKKLETAAASHDPEEETVGTEYTEVQNPPMNPFVGELLLCAAMRLAYEVGYMFLNREMIVGDLSLAAEHLIYHHYELGELLREIRHRVETIRYSDMNEQWNTATKAAAFLIKKNLTDFKEKHGQALRDYLGL